MGLLGDFYYVTMCLFFCGVCKFLAVTFLLFRPFLSLVGYMFGTWCCDMQWVMNCLNVLPIVGVFSKVHWNVSGAGCKSHMYPTRRRWTAQSIPLVCCVVGSGIHWLLPLWRGHAWKVDRMSSVLGVAVPESAYLHTVLVCPFTFLVWRIARV
mgnify:CR=1 FL=1